LLSIAGFLNKMKGNAEIFYYIAERFSPQEAALQV
jgi:hypothetical protein